MISDGVAGNCEGKQNTGQAQIIHKLYNRLGCFFRDSLNARQRRAFGVKMYIDHAPPSVGKLS